MEVSYDALRREFESCDSLEGLQLTMGVSGGTGSGLSSLLLERVRDELGTKPQILAQCAFGSPSIGGDSSPLSYPILCSPLLYPLLSVQVPFDSSSHTDTNRGGFQRGTTGGETRLHSPGDP